MKKKRLALDKKLLLNKSVVTDLTQSTVIGGAGASVVSGPVIQNCVCWDDPNYTKVACPTNQFQLTCRPDDCGLAPSAISCAAGPGCASGNNDCNPSAFFNCPPTPTAICTIGS